MKSVVFLEIKTGTSRLSVRQKQIKDMIEQKNIKWDLITTKDNK